NPPVITSMETVSLAGRPAWIIIERPLRSRPQGAVPFFRITQKSYGLQAQPSDRFSVQFLSCRNCCPDNFVASSKSAESPFTRVKNQACRSEPFERLLDRFEADRFLKGVHVCVYLAGAPVIPEWSFCHLLPSSLPPISVKIDAGASPTITSLML